MKSFSPQINRIKLIHSFDLLIFQAILINGYDDKIDVKTIRTFHSHLIDAYGALPEISYPKIWDHLKVLQMIMSKNVPPERYIGILNLSTAFYYTNVTTEDIEHALVNAKSKEIELST